jgi:hypothetical protein
LGQETCVIYIVASDGQQVEWKWSLEGPGQIDEFGCYVAPSVKQSFINYAVLSAVGLVDGEPRYSGFTVIRFD